MIPRGAQFSLLNPPPRVFYEPLEGSVSQARPKGGRKIARDKSLVVIGRGEEKFLRSLRPRTRLMSPRELSEMAGKVSAFRLGC